MCNNSFWWPILDPCRLQSPQSTKKGLGRSQHYIIPSKRHLTASKKVTLAKLKKLFIDIIFELVILKTYLRVKHKMLRKIILKISTQKMSFEVACGGGRCYQRLTRVVEMQSRAYQSQAPIVFQLPDHCRASRPLHAAGLLSSSAAVVQHWQQLAESDAEFLASIVMRASSTESSTDGSPRDSA